MASSNVHTPHMDEICPGLFLGSESAVVTPEGQAAVLQHAITHVLSVADMKPKMGTLNLKHKFVRANDMPNVDILQHFEDCFGFIDDALREGKILVHCMMGVSRSSTIVIGYLMHRDKITFNEAFDMVRKQHPIAEPNYGFMDLLRLFEAMGCQFSSANPLYRQHRLGQVAENVQAGQEVPKEVIAADPQETTTDQTQTIYKCRKCRRAAFLEASVLAHITGRGQESFQWHKQSHPLSQGVTPSPSGTVDSSVTCTSLFVEPVKWMEPFMIGRLDGKVFSVPVVPG
ncbi:dual specificity protein phosphatase 12-like isoform X2 [Patiria miniata]|uniref:Protein-tyrosine-phosphatase n=1 Tax=Patiria miniata TaxID=46514 RepID=A0A914AJ46_PATMI|nr:dual specificity protein phosphatase 12-like isoform X2 [Patiria miniata]